MIDAVYISHTQECSGWDLNSIIEGTVFKKGARTTRFPKGPESEEIKMLDWDFREASRDFAKVWTKHLCLVQSYDFELVFSPDALFNSEQNNIVHLHERLLDYAKRVVLPVHFYHKLYAGFELAFPVANGFNPTPKNYWLWELRNQFTHILGGSPHTHLNLLKYLPNIKTFDGNQMFSVAIRFGKYWDGKWIKPDPQLTNEECFKLSIQNFNKTLEEKVIGL